ncbi:MAG: SusE domain-containing protein [Bacteroidales bacterium]|nr:SusE domain-containing protein [Bacteroidales bacterium]MCL2133116.1 SusE domain-containing protein [Bacteroidales bacterium]
MKALKTYLFIIALLPLFFGCSKEDASPVLTGIEPSVIDPLPFSSATLTMPETGTNPWLLTVTWTETKFFLDHGARPAPVGPVRYTLEMDIVGNNFADAHTIGSTEALALNIFVKEINSMLVNNFEQIPGTPANVEFRVIANYGLNQPSLTAVSQNQRTITLIPYTPPSDIEAVYIIGNPNGWDNSGKEFIMYRDDNSLTNLVYTYTGLFQDSGDGLCYFKFASESNLGSWATLYCMGTGGAITFGDLDAFNVAAGYHTITLDLGAMTYTIEPYDASAKPVYAVIGAVGSFCDWDNDPEMVKSSYDEHKWTLEYTFDTQTALKFRADHAWTDNWGGQAEDFPYGIAVYDDPGSATVPAGTYMIYFNDLTGHYAVIRK